MWVLQPVHEHHTTDPFSFCCKPLWVTLSSSLQMPACGNWWQNWDGGCMTFVWWWQISRCEQSWRHNWTPSPRWWHGGWQKAPTGHGTSPDHAEHCHRTLEDLWPHCGMGASMQSPLYNFSGCSSQAFSAHGQQCQLGICLCPIEWGLVTCTSIQHGPHQCHDRWHPFHRPSWLIPPVPGA